ncbi:hypothetical protein Rmf_07860 [Roseomonas fluvialis]|uniref:Uncharacterized protein n=1 Tax=Roseomonas fluvialis TaxID=1750527 RepID=A0ABM7XZD3_9PROT|nr:hypothetical protein Rmf_07860 [Roseomonas fluvialis]
MIQYSPAAKNPHPQANPTQKASRHPPAPAITNNPGTATNNTGTRCTGGKASAAKAPNPTAVTHIRHPRRAAR